MLPNAHDRHGRHGYCSRFRFGLNFCTRRVCSRGHDRYRASLRQEVMLLYPLGYYVDNVNDCNFTLAQFGKFDPDRGHQNLRMSSNAIQATVRRVQRE